MLPPDIVQMKQFYSTRLGERVMELLGAALVKMWPSAAGDTMLVIGYATPYMEGYIDTASPLILCMPAEQGAVAWPSGKANHVLLTHDAELPFQNNSINRVLLIHSIEHSENLGAMMDEVWRVLTPGGRVLAVVPNRVSMWVGSEQTPFGFGRPFNVLQLRALLSSHQFTVTRVAHALFTPPLLLKLSRRIGNWLEQMGRVCWWFMGGVLMVEAEKQLYASIKEPVYVRKTRRLRVSTSQTAGAASKKDA